MSFDPPMPPPALEVTSLGDRRKIASLTALVADLEAKLVAANQVAKPSLTVDRERCLHTGTAIVSDTADRVTCADCGQPLEPMRVLRRIAHQEVNFCYRTNSLREEQKKLSAEVEKLKATRARLKQQTRAAKDETPAGIAELARTHGLTGLAISRIGKTPMWGAEALAADSKKASRGHGTIEEALDQALAPFRAAAGAAKAGT